jgi:hypothetical protein
MGADRPTRNRNMSIMLFDWGTTWGLDTSVGTVTGSVLLFDIMQRWTVVCTDVSEQSVSIIFKGQGVQIQFVPLSKHTPYRL